MDNLECAQYCLLCLNKPIEFRVNFCEIHGVCGSHSKLNPTIYCRLCNSKVKVTKHPQEPQQNPKTKEEASLPGIFSKDTCFVCNSNSVTRTCSFCGKNHCQECSEESTSLCTFCKSNLNSLNGCLLESSETTQDASRELKCCACLKISTKGLDCGHYFCEQCFKTQCCLCKEKSLLDGKIIVEPFKFTNCPKCSGSNMNPEPQVILCKDCSEIFCRYCYEKVLSGFSHSYLCNVLKQCVVDFEQKKKLIKFHRVKVCPGCRVVRLFDTNSQDDFLDCNCQL